MTDLILPEQYGYDIHACASLAVQICRDLGTAPESPLAAVIFEALWGFAVEEIKELRARDDEEPGPSP